MRTGGNGGEGKEKRSGEEQRGRKGNGEEMGKVDKERGRGKGGWGKRK